MNKNFSNLYNQILSTIYKHTSISILFLYLVLCVSVLNVNATEVNTTADADKFLKQLQGAKQRGMGGSFVGNTYGANALGNNPAGINVMEGDRFVFHMTRFPRTIALLSKPNLNANYEEHSQYEEQASGIETLNWAFPISKLGTMGLSISTAHEGTFRRVSHEGKAINSFPQNNLAIGIGYGVNWFKGLFIGFDAKWLRSKVTDLTGIEHLGHGYTYNVGLIQEFGDTIQIGIVVRNLSNGLSFTDPNIPDKIHNDIIGGITYQRIISNFNLRIGLDINPPFHDGLRTNIGTEIWYYNRVSFRIGYLRDTESRYGPILLIENATFEMEERSWIAEGLCFGVGVRLGNYTINAAYAPTFKPIVSKNEQVKISQGTANYTFSMGQVF